jgi:hypothetical protein
MRNYIGEELIERARAETGLEHFDDESFREGLDLYLSDYNTNERTDECNERNADYVVKALSDRLRIEDALRQRPELLERPVERPVFVFGVPRTGTTLLSNLLAADPARRSALTWEIEHPVPPPTTATLHTDPRCFAMLEHEKAMQAAHPEMFKFYRNSAVYPNECIFWMIHDFKTMLWESRGKLPNYRDWIYSADVDMEPTYRYHKKFLQLHQADAPGIWNLKLPSHSLWLDTLLKVYPDARLVWTHRDPITATSSFCSLQRLSHTNSLGHANLEWIGENYAWQTAEHARRVMATREHIGHHRIIDVHYADVLRAPIAAMRQLYAALGDDFTPEAEASIRAWLDANPQGKFGRHEYKLAEFGLTAEQVRANFADYLDAYEVEPEG